MRLFFVFLFLIVTTIYGPLFFLDYTRDVERAECAEELVRATSSSPHATSNSGDVTRPIIQRAELPYEKVAREFWLGRDVAIQRLLDAFKKRVRSSSDEAFEMARDHWELAKRISPETPFQLEQAEIYRLFSGKSRSDLGMDDYEVGRVLVVFHKEEFGRLLTEAQRAAKRDLLFHEIPPDRDDLRECGAVDLKETLLKLELHSKGASLCGNECEIGKRVIDVLTSKARKVR